MPEKSNSLEDSSIAGFLLAFFCISILIIGSAYLIAGDAANNKIEEVGTGRGLEIVHGHVKQLRNAKHHVVGFVVISDEGVRRGSFSRAPYGVNINNYFNGINYCIYLQDRLRRTTYKDGRTDYEQYTTFEGIRYFNVDGSCADFPVD